MNLKAKILSFFRKSDKVALFVPEDARGIGNLLYVWLEAHRRRRRGEKVSVVRVPRMAPWLDLFPALRDLTIDASDVRFVDKREFGYFQHEMTESLSHEVEDFVRSHILNSESFAKLVSENTPAEDSVTINVRRGDYYSVPKYRGLYGFDIVSYVETALSEFSLSPGRIIVISDDPNWCRLKLAWLDDICPEVVYIEMVEGPEKHLARLASSSKLILANSTFSYWGGHISSVINSEKGLVIAPWFHRRGIHDGRAFQLDPNWSVVKSIPGGWDA